jgi:anti-sigma-K factor RskA
MSDSWDTDPPEDDMEMLAAEHVLGLLTVAQLPHVVAARRGSPRFERAVQLWELRLLPLAEALPPVTPSPLVWAAIARAIAPAPPRAGLWESLKFWRGFSLAAGALCAALFAAVVLHRPSPAPTAPIATATLASMHDGIFVATAQSVPGGTQLVISPVQVTIPAGKSAELWLIAPGAKPAALGLLAGSHPVAITLPSANLDIRQLELAISIEPPGGSPTGQATGPVIAAAKFLSL